MALQPRHPGTQPGPRSRLAARPAGQRRRPTLHPSTCRGASARRAAGTSPFPRSERTLLHLLLHRTDCQAPCQKPRPRDLRFRPSGRQDVNLRPLHPQDVGAGICTAQRWCQWRARDQSTCGSSAREQTVWSPCGPQPNSSSRTTDPPSAGASWPTVCARRGAIPCDPCDGVPSVVMPSRRLPMRAAGTRSGRSLTIGKDEEANPRYPQRPAHRAS